MHRTVVFLSLLTAFSCKSTLTPDAKENSGLRSTETPTAGRVGLGLNDLSISFPLESQLPGIGAILPKLASKPDPKKFAPGLPAAPEDGEGFLYATTEAEHFDLMGLPISPVAPPNRRLSRTKENMFAEYSLHGLRFVPCANDLEVLGDDSKCLATLQMNWDGPNDHTFHTIYKLTGAEFKEILATLQELHKNASIDTESMPLGTNPVILKEGLDSAYFKGINGLIHRYARASKLYGVAAMHAFTIGEVWVMDQFLVVDKHLVKVPGGESGIDDRASSTGEAQATGSEFDSNPFALARRRPIRFFAGSGLDWKKLAAEDRKVLGVVNPRLHNVRNIRCSSCHTSGNFGGSMDAKDPLLFTSNHWDLSIPTDNFGAASSISIVMFSRGRVSQRVVNETATALNHLVEKGFVPKPAGWNELPIVTKKDLDAVKLEIGGSYRLATPNYPAKACFGPTEGKKDAGTTITGQSCEESSSLVYKLTGELTNASLVHQDSGLCLQIVEGSGSEAGHFENAVCDKTNKNQLFKATGNIHIARFQSANDNPQCMETTFEDKDFGDLAANKIKLFVSKCAASTMTLQKVSVN